MSRVITSPVKKFPGTVRLQDPLYYPQMIAMRNALSAAQSLGGDAAKIDYNRAVLPGIIAVVEEWNLSGVSKSPTPDTFPLTPVKSADALAAWLIGEVVKLYLEEDEAVPNA